MKDEWDSMEEDSADLKPDYEPQPDYEPHPVTGQDSLPDQQIADVPQPNITDGHGVKDITAAQPSDVDSAAAADVQPENLDSEAASGVQPENLDSEVASGVQTENLDSEAASTETIVQDAPEAAPKEAAATPNNAASAVPSGIFRYIYIDWKM